MVEYTYTVFEYMLILGTYRLPHHLMTAQSTESRSALSGLRVVVVVEGPDVVLENLQVLFVLWVGISPPPPSSLWNTFLPAS